MPTSSDIESLFKRFGGDAERYQEIRAEADAERARTRWPLLGLVELADSAPPEQTRPASSGDERTRFEARATTEHVCRSGNTERSSGLLKKLVGKPAAPDATRAPDSSEPLLRVFDRLRAEAPEEGVSAELPARTIRP
ncbi:hypothetical protein WT72_00305 [Burkholderia pseudomultivorans]|uniref:cellulose biosynthesis protein BcsP n=1 Tax=Burkholderia pseudomultivorans TaxID=1207504 RepID=UPI0007593AE1|nr:cellulose biosynthesis protein BcsP [Burkholderia pseudomultivorans]KWI58578.1 hypothetical protein WT72_00305 [Burkholderia pseudomultivorans]